MTTNLTIHTEAMTERAFGVVFTKLAIQLRFTDADVVTVKSYYEAMRDCPLESVEISAVAFAREAGRKWFPTTGEWHEAAQLVLTKQLRSAVPSVRNEPWRHECETCTDTGWVQGLSCPEVFCGRDREHAPHAWTKVCACRPTNRTYQRQQKFGAGS